ncbi:unnamed protein product, partial [Staurois parvus]
CVRAPRLRSARRSVVRCVPGTQWITDQRKEPMTSALSCDQLCPVTDSSVAPSMPPVSAHQSYLPVPISVTSVPTCAHQCHISVPI